MGLSIEELFEVNGTILLEGESGCGKSYWAHQIHIHSAKKKYPFMVLNLASTVEDLLESELFGHIKGAFTGAIQDKKGLAERVGLGTLFLDEVGELSLKAQKKLLYLLEERKFVPVGDSIEKEFKGRIIAATNRDLKKMVINGEFREDLYFRLRVFTYTFLPIRNSGVNLRKYLEHFFNHFKKLFGKEYLEISSECMTVLLNYPWYGNIREIKHCMEYMVTLAKERTLFVNHLPEWIDQGLLLYPKHLMHSDPEHSNFKKNPVVPHYHAILPEYLPMDFAQALEIFESTYLKYILEKYHGRVNFTAEKIKLSKSTLIAKTKKYGINTMVLRARETQESSEEQRTILELSKKR